MASQMTHLLAKVHSSVRPKQVMGRTLNGEMFSTLVQSYAEAMNSGEVPEVSSAWTRVIGTQCHDAKEKALQQYDGDLVRALLAARGASAPPGDCLSLAEALPVDLDTLRTCHESVKAKCKFEYLSRVRRMTTQHTCS